MIRGRQSQMLNKKQEKILFWITGIVVVFLVFISVFIWPNFYIQYRMAKGVTISDVTSSEREIINCHKAQRLSAFLPLCGQWNSRSA